MRKLVLATLTALAIGTAAFAQPAEARCWWNGYSWHCGRPHHAGWYRHHHWGPRYGHHYWGPRYGHHYWGPRFGYGSAYGPRWHSGWGR
jgi:hypothetical protein